MYTIFLTDIYHTYLVVLKTCVVWWKNLPFSVDLTKHCPGITAQGFFPYTRLKKINKKQYFYVLFMFDDL